MNFMGSREREGNPADYCTYDTHPDPTFSSFYNTQKRRSIFCKNKISSLACMFLSLFIWNHSKPCLKIWLSFPPPPDAVEKVDFTVSQGGVVILSLID